MGSDTIEQLENYYGRFLTEFYGNFAMSLVNFVILFFLNKKVAFTFLILSPIIPLFLRSLLKMVTGKQEKYWGKYQDVGQLFLDSLEGITTLKIFNADQKRAEELDQLSEDFRVETMNILKMQLNSITVIEWLAYGGSLVCLAIGVFEFARGNMAAYQLIALFIISLEAFKPMIVLTSTFHVAMTGVAAGKKVIEFLELKEPKGGAPLVQQNLNKFKINDLSFSYQSGEKQALSHVNLEVEDFKGLFAGVGESGCGKSTLMKLISGSYEDFDGDIFWGDNAYQTLDKRQLSEAITRIGHNGHIFEGTVRDNLKMTRENVSEAEMVAALKEVKLYREFEHRGGLDLFLESSGNNLSGGQKQRLCFARGLIKQSNMYIFDEATSNVDVESEEIMINAMAKLAQTVPVFVVAHRLKSVQGAWQIALMSDGKIVDTGTHTELMKHNDLYRNMVTTQADMERIER